MKKDIVLILFFIWLVWATIMPLPGGAIHYGMRERMITPVITLVVKAWLELFYYYQAYLQDVLAIPAMLSVFSMVRGP